MSHDTHGHAMTLDELRARDAAPPPVTALDRALRRLHEYLWNVVAIEVETPIEPDTTLEDVRRRLLVEECLSCPTLTRREAEIVERVAAQLASRDRAHGALSAVASEMGIQPETARGYWHDGIKKIRAWIEARRAA